MRPISSVLVSNKKQNLMSHFSVFSSFVHIASKKGKKRQRCHTGCYSDMHRGGQREWEHKTSLECFLCSYLRFGFKSERNYFQEQLHSVGNIEISDSEQLKVRHRKLQLKIRTEINEIVYKKSPIASLSPKWERTQISQVVVKRGAISLMPWILKA